MGRLVRVRERVAGAAAASRAWRWLVAIPMFLQLERAWGCSRGRVAVAHDTAALPRPWHSPLPLRPLRQPSPLPALPGLLCLSSGSMPCVAASPSCLVRSASIIQVGLRHRLASSRDTKLCCRPCTASQRPCVMAHTAQQHLDKAIAAVELGPSEHPWPTGMAGSHGWTLHARWVFDIMHELNLVSFATYIMPELNLVSFNTLVQERTAQGVRGCHGPEAFGRRGQVI